MPLVKRKELNSKFIEYSYFNKFMNENGGRNLKTLGLYVMSMKTVSLIVWDMTGMNQILRIDAGNNQKDRAQIWGDKVL